MLSPIYMITTSTMRTTYILMMQKSRGDIAMPVKTFKSRKAAISALWKTPHGSGPVFFVERLMEWYDGHRRERRDCLAVNLHGKPQPVQPYIAIGT